MFFRSLVDSSFLRSVSLNLKLASETGGRFDCFLFRLYLCQ